MLLLGVRSAREAAAKKPAIRGGLKSGRKRRNAGGMKVK